MSQAPLKTIVVGCRGVGANHAKAAAASPSFAVVAGCDLVEEAAEELAAQHEGAKAYTDFQIALDAEKPDLVIIATGNASHAKLAIMAAEAGVKGIFCEKPMSVSYGEAKAMVSACEKAGTRMVVNHQRRTSDLFRTMRGVLESGELGDIEFTPELIRQVPAEVARKYGVLPVGYNDEEIELALSDPHNVQALDDLSRILNKRVRGRVAMHEPVSSVDVQALQRRFGEMSGEPVEAL